MRFCENFSSDLLRQGSNHGLKQCMWIRRRWCRRPITIRGCRTTIRRRLRWISVGSSPVKQGPNFQWVDGRDTKQGPNSGWLTESRFSDGEPIFRFSPMNNLIALFGRHGFGVFFFFFFFVYDCSRWWILCGD